jgi:hypothetical protein
MNMRSMRRTYSLTQHSFIVILQTVSRAQAWHETPVDNPLDLLLLGWRPRLITIVVLKNLHGLVVVNRVDGFRRADGLAGLDLGHLDAVSGR